MEHEIPERSETRIIVFGDEDSNPETLRDARGLVAGRYRLGAVLGQGAVSHVYAAKDHWTGEDVALKLLPAYGDHPVVTVERFSAEMRLSRAAKHRNIVRVLDAGHSKQGEPFLVTEALAGETLGACLRKNRTLSVDGALHVVREAARGLAAVHRAGVVHRDVKPDNLFLCNEERHGVSVKLIDFGFATDAGAVEADPLCTLGTPGYIAPEQAIGEAADARADIYSLGVVLFRALTGELPFDDCGERGMLAHHLKSTLPPPSWLCDGIPAEIDAIVHSATRKHPQNRYQTMGAFLKDIDRALSGKPVRGSRVAVEPDAYEPRTETGKKVLSVLGRAAA